MATVDQLLVSCKEFYEDILQVRADNAEAERHRRYLAVLTMQRFARGWLIRKWVAWLNHNAIIIQCAFRVHKARKLYRQALKRAVRLKIAKYYNRKAAIIQALCRGFMSRKYKFCYRSYRWWLALVKERSQRTCAEAAEYCLRSKADDLRILEEEARQWLAFVVFKLHHLLRTQSCAGIYSLSATTELSEFEKLLTAIKYTDYMKRLRKKYNEFVKKNKPKFSNHKVFPIIGEGDEYWYLSLADMYKLTQYKDKKTTRNQPFSHGSQHKKPFMWRRVRSPTPAEDASQMLSNSKPYCHAKPIPTICDCESDSFLNAKLQRPKDPRFELYIRHYKPHPDIFNYIDFYINALLARKYSIENIDNNA